MDKHKIALVLADIAVLLELQGESPFKVRAYRKAARALDALEEDLSVVIAEKRLLELPGIGEHIARMIVTLAETGSLPYYEELKLATPAIAFQLLKIHSLGPRKIERLLSALPIFSIEELQAACLRGDIAALKGFGKKSQQNILAGIERLQNYSKRMLWWNAWAHTQYILKGLSNLAEVSRAESTGSFRRKLETVGHLSYIVVSREPGKTLEWFETLPGVEPVHRLPDITAIIRLRKGIQAELHIVTAEEFALRLLLDTGSDKHVEQLAQCGTLQPLESEEAIYRSLKLDFIPPELREGRGEVLAAQEHRLPKLVEFKDIKGTFHCHTTESDGSNTLEEMAVGAEKLGWEYLGIADHSKASYLVNGLNEERLLIQQERIRILNQSGEFKPYIFAGVECDILEDGSMDIDDDVLAQLDYVVASVHRRFKQDRPAMTARIIKAIENPYVTILGHVTGRILLRREPADMDLEKVIDACIANGVFMELNASPYRLDMDWRYWHAAAEKGLKCCINPDAHSIGELMYVSTGIDMARKGWLRKENVINTLSVQDIRQLLS